MLPQELRYGWMILAESVAAAVYPRKGRHRGVNAAGGLPPARTADMVLLRPDPGARLNNVGFGRRS